MNGNRVPEIKCLAYVHGPMRTAHDTKNKTEPTDHLVEKPVSKRYPSLETNFLGMRRRYRSRSEPISLQCEVQRRTWPQAGLTDDLVYGSSGFARSSKGKR